ncbi:MAG: beta-lactamase family protein [Chloroflexota bacterium]|nr:beta-lactamase family protein [Chloroflexota bacterium]
MSGLNRELVLDGLAYADRWLAYRQEAREMPGLVVAVQLDQDLLLSKAYGSANLDGHIALTPQHIFRVASHSKMFTATAIMQLVEQGRLRLDDSLATHIPWLQSLEELAAVTVRQVLNHSAGIVRDGSDADYWQLEKPFPDGDELRRLAEDGAAVMHANETFKYSNIGFSLLGLVIEATGGLPYNAYVKRHIVDRLGLADTGPEPDGCVLDRLVSGHSARRFGRPRRTIPHIDTRAMSPATGFYSTAEDLCRFGAAQFRGNVQLLSDASKREMQQPYWKIEQAEAHYGLGFSVQTIGERRVVGHNGGFPGQSTSTMIDPVDQLVVVVLINANEANMIAAPIATAMVKIIDFALKQPGASVDASVSPREAFIGRFYNMWGPVDVVAFGNALVAVSPDADDPVQRVTELRVVDEDSLRITSTNGYGSPGEAVRYVRDASGAATAIVSGGMHAYPEEIFRERLLRPTGA